MAIVTADELAKRQHPDGSFGSQPTAEARIVSTIFAARSLHEAGLSDHPSLAPALDFLTRTAIRAGCTIDGRPDGVLCCYTGMLARLLIGTGRHDAAEPLLNWIITYQPVAFGGTTYHQPSGPPWGDYLRHRYGGCMSDTTCLLGLAPTIGALVDAHDAGLGLPASAHLDAMRKLLTDRQLVHGRNGSVIPLSGRTKADPDGARWLLPAFPRDYVIDLIELVELAQRLKVPIHAMTHATELIKSWRLPDGGWPLLGTRRIVDAYRPEPVNRRRPSHITTARVLRLHLPL
jgi:hypothetical protein